jgi:hypothetical protein
MPTAKNAAKQNALDLMISSWSIVFENVRHERANITSGPPSGSRAGQLIIAFEYSSTVTCPLASLYSGATFRPWDGMTALERSKRCNSSSMRRSSFLARALAFHAPQTPWSIKAGCKTAIDNKKEGLPGQRNSSIGCHENKRIVPGVRCRRVDQACAIQRRLFFFLDSVYLDFAWLRET